MQLAFLVWRFTLYDVSLAWMRKRSLLSTLAVLNKIH